MALGLAPLEALEELEGLEGLGGAGRGWQGLAGDGPHPFRVPRGFGRREVLSTSAHLNPFLLPLSPGMHFEGVTGTGVVAVGWIVPGK